MLRGLWYRIHILCSRKAETLEHVPEKFISVGQAAKQLGIPLFKIRRAVKAGIIPSYSLFNSRRLVRLSEVVQVINASRQGGENE